MPLYNYNRAHNAKSELVGLASAIALFVWFWFWLENDPGIPFDTWR